MTVVTVHEAKTQLSRLIRRACSGEEIVIARGEHPVVRLTPVPPVQPGRQFGAMRDRIRFTDSFFAPLPAEEIDAWEP